MTKATLRRRAARLLFSATSVAFTLSSIANASAHLEQTNGPPRAASQPAPVQRQERRPAGAHKLIKKTSKTSEKPAKTITAIALHPEEQARAWLGDAEKRGRSFRVAVRVELSPLGVTAAYLGSSAIKVRIDDSALGMSLADRARHLCPQSGSAHCSLWVWAKWRKDTLVITRVDALATDPASLGTIEIAHTP